MVQPRFETRTRCGKLEDSLPEGAAEFIDILKRADQLREDMIDFARRGNAVPLLQQIMDHQGDREASLFAREAIDALCGTAFQLRAFRLVLMADFGSQRWWDGTECKG
ncbi:hypothetical protein [Limnoglobus roseus]|uniref:Uncharacterized protein n=1 Tax=Limnoglobus roseus TaxID=2598579 RepID=A0A5C1AN35_9BACT|nr:hypothetical protein [Limnoglobus roseus]QEL18328.1 hypothetical protein PX52LOC_05349 [Limnoglobus roseus]